MRKADDILGKMHDLVQNPLAALGERKKQSPQKIIGCAPMHFPEEIIHAGGALPIMVPESEEPITLGHTKIQTYICGYVRSSIDIALKGQLDFLDGWVFPDTCHSIRGMTGIIKRNINPPFYRPIYPPVVIKSPYAREFYLDELRRFKADLERFLGAEISAESLSRSITIYNHNHTLLRRLYDLRRTKPGLLRAKDVQAIVVASMLMPKEEHSELLERLLPQLEAEAPEVDDRVRLVISGSLCEPVDDEILDLIEDAGAVIVDDDLYTGSRYFVTDAEPADKPMEAMVNRYLNMVAPCPTRAKLECDWGDYLADMAKKARAQSVIHILAKFCEPHAFFLPHLKKKLTEAGLSDFLLETEHEERSYGQFRTRVETFLWIIKNKEEKAATP